jgi:hypothetical protein
MNSIPNMKKFSKFSLLVFILMSNLATYAQPGGDTGGGGLEGNDPPPAPINTLLLATAIIGTLFVFKIYQQQSKKA